MPKEHNLFGTRIPKPKTDRYQSGLLIWLICLITLAGAWLLAGCTSDIPSEVGTGLVNSEIDVVLEALPMEDLELYTAKNISDNEVSLLEQEVLYFGSQDGNSSSILLNYDFSDVFTEEYPDTMWTQDHISKVELRLVRLKFFGGTLPIEDEEEEEEEEDDDVVVIEKNYDVFELFDPFDGGQYPGEIPEHTLTAFNVEDADENLAAAEPRLEFRTERLLSWVIANEVQGLIITEGEGSTEGLIGFASNDLTHADELELIHENPGASPIIIVEFDGDDTKKVFIEPMADISTFHELKPAPLDPADGLMLRTCIRTYPMLRFDLSTLPENVFINRAVLSLTNNTSTSFGQLEGLVVSEIDVDLFGTAGDSMSLENLDGDTYTISGMTSLDPYTAETMEFLVTTAVQRIINDVYDGERGFILTAGEDFYSAYNLTGVSPDFYFNQFDFFGTAADDTLRPKLKITYSSIDDLTGGGK